MVPISPGVIWVKVQLFDVLFTIFLLSFPPPPFLDDVFDNKKLDIFVCPGQLFHRVGLMSGSAFSPDALVRDPAAAAMAVASRAQCDGTTSPDDLLECLRAAPLDALLPPEPPPPQPLPSSTPLPTSDATTTEDDNGLLGSAGADEDAEADKALLEMGPTVDGVVVTAEDTVDPAFFLLVSYVRVK